MVLNWGLSIKRARGGVLQIQRVHTIVDQRIKKGRISGLFIFSAYLAVQNLAVLGLYKAGEVDQFGSCH
jgi:hypothetical protein